MTAYACVDYFLARVPDFAAILPSYPITVALDAAMALYWDRFIPRETGLWVPSPANAAWLVAPPLNEALLTERQKVIVALRAALGTIPVFTQGFTNPFLIDAKAGPTEAEFEDLSKVVKALTPLWQTELKNLEAFEDIFFDLLPNVPGYLQKWREFSCFDNSVGYVFSTGSWFVDSRTRA